MTDKEIEARKEKIIAFLKHRKDWIQYVLLFAILWLAVYIRKQNWELLKDATTGKYISLEIDSALFLRYSQYIAEHGKLFAVDMMRSYPLGLPLDIGTFTAYFIAFLYKILHIFSSSITVEFANVIYPTIATVIASVFLFLLVRRLLDYRVALLSVLFLVTSPVFLFRSISSDHDILGLMFVFMTLYFFVAGWQAKKKRNHILFGILAAFSAILGFYTAGNIKVFIMVVAIFTVMHILLDSVKENDLYVFPIWYVITFGWLLLSGKLAFRSMISDYTAGLPATIAFLGLLLYFLIDTKYFNRLKFYKKLESRLPRGFIVLSSVALLGFLFMNFFYGFSHISGLVRGFFDIFSKALVFNRWASTVAENKRVFVQEWFTSFNDLMVWLFIIGILILVYKFVRRLKDHKKLFVVYSVSILAFIFSRYSENSVLNGSTGISKLMFYGSVLLVVVYTIYYHLTNYYKSVMHGTKYSVELDWRYTFILVISLVNVVGGTTAVRLFFELSPFIVIMSSFCLVVFLDWFLLSKPNVLKYGGIIILFLVLFSPFSFAKGIVLSDARASYDQVRFSGPGYHGQWQNAGKWVRENTPEDSIFIHWWDYGYWVQGGFERATVTDGGNRIWWWNYLTARELLTAPEDEDSLKFLYSHDVDYLLIISEELGKYPAYSLIGSDRSFDRYSFINIMGLDNSQSMETRNGTLLVYAGGYPLDGELVVSDMVYPRGTVIAGVLVELKGVFDSNGTAIGASVEQPQIALVYNGNVIKLSMKCIYIDRLYIFENYDYGGCARVIPTMQGNQGNNLGAIVFLSEKVAKSLFARFYVLESKSNYFELVYNDVSQAPLALYNGRLIGPVKIWKVNYPEDFSVNQTEYDYNNMAGFGPAELMQF